MWMMMVYRLIKKQAVRGRTENDKDIVRRFVKTIGSFKSSKRGGYIMISEILAKEILKSKDNSKALDKIYDVVENEVKEYLQDDFYFEEGIGLAKKPFGIKLKEGLFLKPEMEEGKLFLKIGEGHLWLMIPFWT